jgi:hypothetical protein
VSGGRRFRRMSKIVTGSTIAGIAVSGGALGVGPAEPAAASPPGSGGDYLIYFVGSAPNGTFQMYDNSSLYLSLPAGSGSATVNNPCNKYTGAGDGDGGGRIPSGGYNVHGTHNGMSSWPWAWSNSHDVGGFFSAALALQDKAVIGCGVPITRDGLYVHRKNTTWVSFGCVKINDANMTGAGSPPPSSTLDYWFHYKAGGSNGGDYLTNVFNV